MGLAKSLSMSLIGKQIDGIYHTGICVYGKEYFYGNGINCENEGATPFGTPTETIELGETELPQEMFHDFLQDISERFTFLTYNIATNNCNHFTNECSTFLVDKTIPDFALKQAEEFFETPLGQMVKPMVMAQQNALIQGASSMFDTGSAENENKTLNVNPEAVLNTFSQLQGETPVAADLSDSITAISDISLLQESIITTPCLVLYLWSSVNEECKDSNTKIGEIAEKFSNDETSQVTFFSVNTQQVVEVAYNFNVKTIPCAYVYQNGEVVLTQEKFDPEELEQKLTELKKE
ncbi:unnamed protein product [Moneuplotes crassus]|uniref:PPPDE domain-containing protein n=1 Tax=Euplotes crassus TaxID=5936 RepID=A0AAD1XMH6_EUPCR|nr:unnamed protein product [Moneuplotes crassus]